MSYGGYEYGGNDDGYGGGGGGGWNQGGGFLGNDHVGGNQGSGFPGGSPGAKVNSRERQTIMPLTIRQVMTASLSEGNDNYRVDGVELHQIKLVGQIIEMEDTATNSMYTIDDGTGRTTVKMLADSDGSDYKAEKRAACQKGVYVKIVGQLRDWQRQKYFNVFDMRVIKDANEITHHLLEAIYAHCYNTKGGPVNKVKAGALQTGLGGNLAMPFNQGGFNAGATAGMSPLQEEVLAAFRDGVGDQGEDIAHVIAKLGSRGRNAQQIRDAVEFLTNEGHLYTTSDESHFKATS